MKEATEKDPATCFRDKIGSNNLQFAATYYPWLETSVLSDNDITRIISMENLHFLVPFFNWTPPLRRGGCVPLDKYVGLLDRRKRTWKTTMRLKKSMNFITLCCKTGRNTVDGKER